jgi:hypothetical protein
MSSDATQRVAEMFDSLKVGDALSDLAKATAQIALKDAAAVAAKELGKEWVAEAVPELAGVVAGGIVRAALKILLPVSDRVAKKLNTLLRAPFETGIRMVTEAITLSVSTTAEEQFCDHLLVDGITELERAWTLAADGPTAANERFYIRLLQGLAGKCVTGANEYAVRRLTECTDVLLREQDDIRKSVRDLHARSKRALEEAAWHQRLSDSSSHAPGFGGAASMYHHQMAQSCREKGAGVEQEIAEYERRSMTLNEMILILSQAIAR